MGETWQEWLHNMAAMIRRDDPSLKGVDLPRMLEMLAEDYDKAEARVRPVVEAAKAVEEWAGPASAVAVRYFEDPKGFAVKVGALVEAARLLGGEGEDQ
jgi:hypothetical protein